jgi:hypothetical protein
MSSTRTAAEGTPFRQERFASSAIYEQGLLGNLVAKRCRTIRNPENRALVYWLQALSHLEGGLKLFAEKFLAAFAHRIGTPTMRQIGKTAGQVYTYEEAETLYNSGLNFAAFADRDTLAVLGIPRRQKPVYDSSDFISPSESSSRPWDCAPWLDEESKEEAWRNLHNCTVDEAMQECLRASENLPDFLKQLCLDPSIEIEPLNHDSKERTIWKYAVNSDSVWWFDNIISALHECRKAQIEEAKQSIAETTISRQIFEDLEFAAYIKGLVLIEGEQRTGKSKAAEAWAAAHPGKAIYLRLESGKDELSFYRTIARAIGTASSSQMKAQEMRLKIEDMLQEKHLMLIIDEAHFLFPIIARPKSAPGRVDWLRTALIDHGVAVACISTPQFDRQCAHYEKGIGWNAKQIKGRVKLQRLLPSALPVEDLAAVARKMVPAASAAQIDGLVGFAQLSAYPDNRCKQPARTDRRV